MNDRIYAIGDIHGHLDALQKVHDLVRRDGGGIIVHVGDLVDRGPDSAGVVSYLLSGIKTGEPWVVLKGNHDRMMPLYLETPSQRDPILRRDYSWLHHRLGGLTTLASYGVLPMDETDPKAPKGAHWLHPKGGGLETLTSYGIDLNSTPDRELAKAARAAVPREHKAFLDGLDITFQTPDVLFTHAGIRPGVALKDQVEDDLIWIRDPFLNDTRDHGPLIVHGHSPINAATHYGNRVNIDSGVAFGGPLSGIVIEERDVWLLTQEGRKPLLPQVSG